MKVHVSLLILGVSLLAGCGHPDPAPLALGPATSPPATEVIMDSPRSPTASPMATVPAPPGGEGGPFELAPPPASQAIGGKVQMSGIGSYCWSDDQTGRGVCADAIGIPTLVEPLPARSPLTAQIRLPLEEPPFELQFNVIRVTEQDALPSRARGYRWWPWKEGRNVNLPLERQPQVELTLEPGLYVLHVSAWWHKQGDASYGFLVQVQPKGGE